MLQMRRVFEFTKKWKLPTSGRASGAMLLGLILLVPLLSACSQAQRAYDSTTRTILLVEAPVVVPCRRGEQMDDCMLVLKQDWENLIISYKSMCLRLGGADTACQTNETAK